MGRLWFRKNGEMGRELIKGISRINLASRERSDFLQYLSVDRLSATVPFRFLHFHLGLQFARVLGGFHRDAVLAWVSQNLRVGKHSPSTW